MSNKIPVSEEIDFHYLLGLMPPLHNVPEFSWLPELFSIIGHAKLILLVKYAGGETIKIPTADQLCASIDALQWFYDIKIAHRRDVSDIPEHLSDLYNKIVEVYDVRENKGSVT